MENRLLRVGDLITIQINSRGHSFSLFSQGFYPSSLNLCLTPQLEPIHNCFLIYRKSIDYDHKSLDEEGGNREPINYDEVILLKHYISQKFLCIRESDTSIMQLHLRTSLGPECEFKLLPLFKCQTVNSRRVRQEQDVLLASAHFQEGVQNLMMVVQEASIARQIKSSKESFNGTSELQLSSFNSDFFMNKSAYSSITIHRKGESDDSTILTSRRLYRMKNIQSERWLNFEDNGTVAFNNSPSEFESFMCLIRADSYNSFVPLTNNESVYISSQKDGQFLEISSEGARLVPKPTRNCQFRVLDFRESTPSKLSITSVFFLQHSNTGKFLSAEFNQLIGEMQCRLSSNKSLKDTVQFVPVSEQSINRMFFLSQVRTFLGLFGRKQAEAKQRIEQLELLAILEGLLQDMVAFIYRLQPTLPINEFMGQFIGLAELPVPKQEDQLSFLHSKILLLLLELLAKLSGELVKPAVAPEPSSKKGGKEDGRAATREVEGSERKSVQKRVIRLLYVLVAGICSRNLETAKVLLAKMQCIYENLPHNIGAIECFIQVFRDNRTLLRLLENETINGQPCIFTFLDRLRSVKKGATALAINIAEFLRSLVLVNGNEALRLNQTVVGNELIVNGLEKILLIEMKVTNDGELTVKPWKEDKDFIQIEDMYIRKSKYTQDLALIENQLQLYSSLCYGRNYVNIEHLKKRIPYETIVRYMNKLIDGEFKSILLGLFVTIYLDVSPRKVQLRESIVCLGAKSKNTKRKNTDDMNGNNDLTGRLLVKGMEMEMTEYLGKQTNEQGPNLEDIKILLLEETENQISQARFTEAFHMYIEVLGKFIAFGMVTPSQKSKFERSLEKFLSYKGEVGGVHRLRIYSGVLGILLRFELDDEDDRLADYVLGITERFSPETASRLLEVVTQDDNPTATYELKKELLGVLFDTAVSLVDYGLLDRLALFSIRNSHPKQNLLRRLKSVIVLEDSESIQLYSRVKKSLVPELDRRFENFSLAVIKNDPSFLHESVRRLNGIFEQINSCFISSNSRQSVENRTLHIMRELGVHNSILNFLVENCKQTESIGNKDDGKDIEKVFKAAFRFLILFISGELGKNIKSIRTHFSELKRYLLVPDFGQKRFFLLLSKVESIKQAVEGELVEASLACLLMESNLESASILLEYTRKQSVISKRSIDDMGKRLLAEQKYFEGMLKVRKTASGWEVPLDERSKPILTLYYLEVFKLINTLSEHLSEKKYFHSLVRKFLPFESLLRLLQLANIFDERRGQALLVTLLHREVLKTVSLLYLQQLKLQQKGVELFMAFLQKNQRMLNFYNQQADSEKSMMLNEFIENDTDDCNDILRLTEGLEDNAQSRNTTFLRNFEYMLYVLVQLGPIAGQLLQTVIESDGVDELTKRQLTMLKESFESLIQQSIYEMLASEEFEKHPIDFLRGIDRCGEAFKTKFKLSFQIKNHEQQRQTNDEEGDSGDILIDRRLKSVVDAYKRSITPLQKSIYKSVFQMMQRSQLKELVKAERKQYESMLGQTLNLGGDRREKVLKMFADSFTDKLQKNTIQKREQRQYFKYIARAMVDLLANKEASVELRKIIIQGRLIECSMRYMAKNIFTDPAILNRIVELCIGLLGRQIPDHSIQVKFHREFQQTDNKAGLFRVLRGPIEEQKLAYSKYLYNQERIYTVSSTQELSYEPSKSSFHVTTCLQFYAALVRGDNRSLKESLNRQSNILEDILDLLKVYLRFSFNFSRSNKVYYPPLVDRGVCACMETLLQFINYQPTHNLNILVEKNFIELVNTVLGLSDGLRDLEESDNLSPLNRTENLISECTNEEAKRYLKSIYYLSVNSDRFYKELGGINNPFLPTIPNYVRVKTKVIRILSELINLRQSSQLQAILKNINEHTLKRNMLEIYEKQLYLFQKDYTIYSFDLNSDQNSTTMVDYKQSVKKKVEGGMRLENGFCLLSVLFRLEKIRHDTFLEQRLDAVKKRVANESIIEVLSFCKDFGKICAKMFTSCCGRKILIDQYIRSKSESEGMLLAIEFFLIHNGRVQVVMGNQHTTVNFPILPECERNTNIEKRYLSDVDLSSVQTKNESLMKYTQRFLNLHENEDRYKRKYDAVPFVDLLLRHIELFKNISFVLTVVLNIIILVNSSEGNSNYIDPQYSVYNKIMIVQWIITMCLLVFFTLKEMPLVVLETNRSLERRKLQYGSNFVTYPLIVQWSIWFFMIALHPPFLYHLLYTIFVTVAYFRHIFIAVLLLDIFIRIPLLRRILMSIWRPKLQIILTIVAFVLVEYYFSIVLYYNFSDHTYGICKDLQSCFSFVFYVTYKVVGGFPGFIFQFKQSGSDNFQIDLFSLFQDVYVIIIFQIFFAVLCGIIIDNFSILRTEQEQKNSNLKSYCLVCGANSNTVNESRSNFARHVALEHNIWHYFNFVTYVSKKPAATRSELQQHVADAVKSNTIDWLPSCSPLATGNPPPTKPTDNIQVK